MSLTQSSDPGATSAISPMAHNRRPASRWTLAPDGRHLLRDGRDDFLLLDTLWAALQRAPLDDLRSVLDRRSAQGFTGVLLTLLPVANDRSGPVPVVLDTDSQSPRFAPDYLARAREKLGAVVDAGLTPVLVLSWVCWLPGTWANAPIQPLDSGQLLDLTAQAVREFACFNPIWVVSGDDTMTSPDAVATYVAMSEVVRRLDPEALIAAHTGAFVNVPQDLLEAVDIVAFQSGHEMHTWRSMPQAWNRHLAARTPPRVRLNAEPPYEGHGYGEGRGRHDRQNVLTASWASVLTGAGAGLGYGAHGLWSWHRSGDSFTSIDWSSMPFDALDAALLPGAVDVGWLRSLAVHLRAWELDDRTDLVQRDNSGAVAGATPDLSRVVVYAPVAGELVLLGTGARVTAWSLDRRERCAVTASNLPGNRVHLGMPTDNGPHLYLLER